MNFINRLSVLVLLMLITTWGFAQVNSNRVWVNGYYRSNGTYVEGYYRTAPNNTNRDNYSTRGNVNPYTGKPGYVTPDGVYSSGKNNRSAELSISKVILRLKNNPYDNDYKNSVKEYLLKCLNIEITRMQSSLESDIIGGEMHLSTKDYIFGTVVAEATTGGKKIMFKNLMNGIFKLVSMNKNYNINSEYNCYTLLVESGIKGFYAKINGNYYKFSINEIRYYSR